MNKNIKNTKLIIIITTLIILLSTNVQALTMDPNERAYICYDDEVPYHYEAEEKVRYKMLDYKDSVLYTLNRDNTIVMTLFTNAESYVDAVCERILENGYPNKTYQELGLSNRQQAYFATQEALYAYLENKDMEKYIAENEEGTLILNSAKQILEKAKKEDVVIKAVDEEWKEYSQTEEQVYKTYTIELDAKIQTANIQIENGQEVQILNEANESISSVKNGDNIKIIVPKGINQNFKVKLTYEKQGVGVYKCYHESNTSIKYLTFQNETLNKEKTIEVEYKYKTPVTIQNLDNETKEPIQGNVFEVLDNSLNKILENLTTNENGKIDILLEEGEYFLKQTQVKDEYTISKNKLSFKIENIENLNLNIYNSKQVKEEITKEKEEINLTSEDKKIVENEVTNVTNIHTTNVEKEIIQTTNETNLEKENTFEDTTYVKNISNIEEKNQYPNKTWNENVTYKTLLHENDITNMSKEQYAKYMEYIKLGNIVVPNLPVAVKQ